MSLSPFLEESLLLSSRKRSYSTKPRKHFKTKLVQASFAGVRDDIVARGHWISNAQTETDINSGREKRGKAP